MRSPARRRNRAEVPLAATETQHDLQERNTEMKEGYVVDIVRSVELYFLAPGYNRGGLQRETGVGRGTRRSAGGDGNPPPPPQTLHL